MGRDTPDAPPVEIEPIARRPSCDRSICRGHLLGDDKNTYVVCTAAKIKLYPMLELISHTRKDMAHQSSNMPM